jgi:hypothetical protein
MIKKKCLNCNKIIKRSLVYSHKQRESAIFCNAKCQGEFKTKNKSKLINCNICNKQVKKTFSQIKRGAKYCSKKCFSEAQLITLKGKGNPFFGKNHSKKTKEKISLSTLGKPKYWLRREKSKFWRGGVSKRNNRNRNKVMATLEYRNFRRFVLERDDYNCQLCGSKDNLEVHHLKSYEENPDLKFIVENGQTLCNICHRKTDTYSRHI